MLFKRPPFWYHCGLSAGGTKGDPMRQVRDWAGLALVIAASTVVNAYYVTSPARSWDETINVKASLHDVSDYTGERGYVYSIDHPALKRYVYGAVLRACGITSVETPEVDYAMGEQWNIEHGHLPPLAVVMPLRAVNAAVMTGAVVIIYLAALAALGNGWLAALTAAPLLFSERIANGAVSYIGCDAFLAFFMALALYLMILLAGRKRAVSLPGVVLLGIVAGLATCAKLNGALVVVAVMIYLALAARGADRVMKPVIAGATALVIFLAVNPVMRGGGLDWIFGVVWDMMARRRYIWHAQYEQFTLSRVQLVARFFPYAPFVWAVIAGGVILRRRKWLPPLAIWSAVLVIGTLVSVNRTYDRYFLPVHMGTFTFAGIVTWSLVSLSPRSPRRHRLLTRAAAILAPAALTAAALMAVLAAWAPFGPSRLRSGFPAARKVVLFQRQAKAFYGLERRLDRRAAFEFLGAPQPAREARQVKMPKPLFTPLVRRVISYAFFAAGLALIYAPGARMLESRALGLLMLAPFLWSDFSQGDFWLHSASDCFLVFFTSLSLYFWLRPAGRGGTRHLLLAAAFSGAAFAAAPRAVVLAAAVSAHVFLNARGLRRLTGWLGSLVAAGAGFFAVERAIWHLGADATLRFARAMYSGALVHWSALFGETTNVLLPLRESFPYWPLLPLAGAALWAVRHEKWAGVLALYGSFTVAAAFLGRPASANRVRVDVHLALALCAGVPALALLARQVSIRFALKQPREAMQPRESAAP